MATHALRHPDAGTISAVAIVVDSGDLPLFAHSKYWSSKEFGMNLWFRRATFAAIASVSLISAVLAKDTKTQNSTKPHRVVIQVDQNDPAVMNLALNNATNVIEYYRAKGEDVELDVVTYGPGLTMLRADASPVKDRIKALKDTAFPSTVQFSACNITKQGMEKKEGHPIDILSDAVIVPSGVVRLIELQEKGWSYIRP
jgi:intracellular sulfur oxidation DsrE/DsrF family protein